VAKIPPADRPAPTAQSLRPAASGPVQKKNKKIVDGGKPFCEICVAHGKKQQHYT